MTQYLDPVIISIAVMDENRLLQTRTEYLQLLRSSRRRFWRLWARNRTVYLVVFVFYAFLVFSTISAWTGDSRVLFDWSLLVAMLISWLITWLCISHTPLNTFLERWDREETVEKEELDKHQYTVNAIHRRRRELQSSLSRAQ